MSVDCFSSNVANDTMGSMLEMIAKGHSSRSLLVLLRFSSLQLGSEDSLALILPLSLPAPLLQFSVLLEMYMVLVTKDRERKSDR